MWMVLFSQRFDDWLNEQEDALQEKVLADLIKLQVYGPELPREGANKRGNTSRLTQSFHFFMFEPIFSPVNALNQPI